MSRKKFFFEKCPTQQCNELDDESFERIEEFYNSSYKHSYICRRIFDVACSFDKTLLTLIAGSLTSLSINFATGFINMEVSSFNAELVFHILQFFFAVGFNVYTIRFAAKVINIQEYGEMYFPSQQVSKKLINEAQKNIMFYACMNNEKYLKRLITFGGICLMITTFSMFFESLCVGGISEIMIFFRNSWTSLLKFLERCIKSWQ